VRYSFLGFGSLLPNYQTFLRLALSFALPTAQQTIRLGRTLLRSGYPWYS